MLDDLKHAKCLRANKDAPGTMDGLAASFRRIFGLSGHLSFDPAIRVSQLDLFRPG